MGITARKAAGTPNFSAGRKISVPFTYETQAGGIGEQSFHPVVWYSRPHPGTTAGNRTLLHFDGSDFYTRGWLNGKFAGEHRGGYTRFSFDITGLLEDGRNILTVRVEDFNDTCQTRGKQRWRAESFGCWYVQTTGIWKSVWLEYVTPSICRA
jgi:beta-galactosidase/beta-glucuronidase